MSEDYFNDIINGSLQDFLNNIDKNGDGAIDFNEFQVNLFYLFYRNLWTFITLKNRNLKTLFMLYTIRKN